MFSLQYEFKCVWKFYTAPSILEDYEYAKSSSRYLLFVISERRSVCMYSLCFGHNQSIYYILYAERNRRLWKTLMYSTVSAATIEGFGLTWMEFSFFCWLMFSHLMIRSRQDIHCAAHMQCHLRTSQWNTFLSLSLSLRQNILFQSLTNLFFVRFLENRWKRGFAFPSTG